MALVVCRIKFFRAELFLFAGWNKNIYFFDHKLIANTVIRGDVCSITVLAAHTCFNLARHCYKPLSCVVFSEKLCSQLTETTSIIITSLNSQKMKKHSSHNYNNIFSLPFISSRRAMIKVQVAAVSALSS